ncbi:MAG: patatin-like phospholipase family protein, partial [Gemmatimonadales bacterium]
MQALVLSGGNIKGAFQAGAIGALLRTGLRPGIITGISVGALNGAFLVSRAARSAAANGGVPDWPAVGEALVAFWRERITGPEQLLNRRNAFDLGWRLLRKNWAGLVDMAPLYRLVDSELRPEGFLNPPVLFAFGAVSLDTGDIRYAPVDPDTGARVIEYVKASTAEPITMDLRVIAGESYYDGGLRDLAPLKRAIDLGATSIVCVACQPERVGDLGPEFPRGDPLRLVGRVMEIVTNELLNGDLATLVEVNQLLEE